MEKYIDLHTHSRHSDGSLTPTELVRLAGDAGLSAVALTDHDCTDGISEAAAEAERQGIELVPGIELSARFRSECHILGYFIDPQCHRLQEGLDEIKKVRARRSEQTSKNLGDLGIEVSTEEAAAYAGGEIIGRAHFARAMVDKGYVSSVKEAFDKYFHAGRPAFASQQLFTPGECIDLIHDAGGIAFAAHLHTLGLEGAELEQLLKSLRDKGLDGIEGYYSEYTPHMHKSYVGLAEKLDLAVSGGTDFHGEMKPHIQIGSGRGGLRIPYGLLGRIRRVLH